MPVADPGSGGGACPYEQTDAWQNGFIVFEVEDDNGVVETYCYRQEPISVTRSDFNLLMDGTNSLCLTLEKKLVHTFKCAQCNGGG